MFTTSGDSQGNSIVRFIKDVKFLIPTLCLIILITTTLAITCVVYCFIRRLKQNPEITGENSVWTASNIAYRKYKAKSGISHRMEDDNLPTDISIIMNVAYKQHQGKGQRETIDSESSLDTSGPYYTKVSRPARCSGNKKQNMACQNREHNDIDGTRDRKCEQDIIYTPWYSYTSSTQLPDGNRTNEQNLTSQNPTSRFSDGSTTDYDYI